MHDLAAAYVLDALDDDERADFETHLRSCAACRAAVDELREPVADLALSVSSLDPPVGLRSAILDAARAERDVVVPFRSRRSRLAPVATLGFVAAAAAALVLGLWVSSLRHSLARERAAVSVFSDPAARHIPVRGARGALVVAPSGRAALTLALPAPPAGRQYEAWVMSPQAHRAAVFSGGATRLSLPVHRGDVVAVTLERAGGVDTPTSNPLLTARA